MQIIPIQLSGSYRTGTISKYTKEQIINILGFEPNVEDDPDKVVNSWAFMVNGHECAIWDYKGSHHYNMWSIYDPHNVLGHLFCDGEIPMLNKLLNPNDWLSQHPKVLFIMITLCFLIVAYFEGN